MATSFKDYVKAARVTDSPTGDFIGDAKTDKRLPVIKSWKQLETYLVTRNGSAALDGARGAWRNYLSYRRRVES